MTPEERLTRIENAIQSLAETQARHDSQIEKNNQQIEKNTAGIRDLIVVSRSLVEAQFATDNRLNTLIETVDRLSTTVDTFVRSLQKPNGNQ